jgi:hypothetical protein
MRWSETGLRRHQTKALYPDHPNTGRSVPKAESYRYGTGVPYATVVTGKYHQAFKNANLRYIQRLAARTVM